MQVTLRVVGGKHNGREIKVAGPQFTIGRVEGADLRPTSDLVSRKHCSISIEKGEVIIKDLGSRNGTFINGEQISEAHVAKPGDLLRVGRLQFELVLDPSRSAKRDKVDSVVEAAARTAQSASKPAGIEDNIGDWLESGDEESETDKRTIRFQMDETQTIEKAPKEILKGAADEIEIEPDSKESKKKKKPGKLPSMAKKKDSSADSKAAADEALKKFFNRR